MPFRARLDLCGVFHGVFSDEKRGNYMDGKNTVRSMTSEWPYTVRKTRVNGAVDTGSVQMVSTTGTTLKHRKKKKKKCVLVDCESKS